MTMTDLSNILILSDFDGTFAGKGSKIVQRNIEAIKHFQKLGGHFTFCTGRLPSVMRKVYPDFRSVVNSPMIMCNGAIILDPVADEIIEERFFDGIRAREDLKDILSKFDISLACYADDGTYQSVSSPEEIVGNRFRKINLSFKCDSDAIACRTYVNNTYSDRYICFRSSNSFAEIVDKNVSKGRRISYMKEYYRSLGIDDLKVYCIGDYENDIDMLENADKAFCPSNAIDEVKAVCHKILCDHNDGAVADMIEYILSGASNE
jgi:HAD superfamily hydrolase (TIGR01484 family)